MPSSTTEGTRTMELEMEYNLTYGARVADFGRDPDLGYEDDCGPSVGVAKCEWADQTFGDGYYPANRVYSIDWKGTAWVWRGLARGSAAEARASPRKVKVDTARRRRDAGSGSLVHCRGHCASS